MRIALHKHIIADPTICHGKPTFKGTRVMVWQVLEMLAAGATHGEVRSAFPTLSGAHIRAALEYASSITRENYVVINTRSNGEGVRRETAPQGGA